MDFRHFVSASFWSLALAAAAAGAAPVAVPPAERLAFANGLVRRGLCAEALGEYEVLRRDHRAFRPDELLFRIGEAHRSGGDVQAAITAYTELIAGHPASVWRDYALLNRALLSSGPTRERDLVALDRTSAPAEVRQRAVYQLAADAEAGRHAAAACDLYARVVKLCATNRVGNLATLKSAAIRSRSESPADRRRAMAAYYELSFARDAKLAEESTYLAVLLSYRERRYSEAAALYRRLSEKFPAGSRAKDAATIGAWSNHLAGKHAEALAIAAEVAARTPDSEDAAYLKAVSLQRLERRDEALEAVRGARRRFPRGKYADALWLAEVDLLAAGGAWGETLAEIEARGTPPDSCADRVHVLAYEAAVAVTNYPKALEYARLAGASKTAAVASRARYVEGVLEARLGRGRQAVEVFTRLLAEHPEAAEAADALRTRASEELRLGDFRAARRSFDELVRRFPDRGRSAESLYWRGVAARGTDDAPEAERLFRAALAAGPAAEFAREAKLELAALLEKRGADREAAELFSSVLSTKAAERLSPASLSWLAETCLAASNAPSALKAAERLERRGADATWNQIGAELVGRIREFLGEADAARAAYVRALAEKARTDAGARSALALGRLESAAGDREAARRHLSEAVERAHAESMAPVRARAYAALAANEEADGRREEALRFHMLVATLFDDSVIVPVSMKRAIALLRESGRAPAAAELEAELRRRYPKAGGR